MVRRKGDYDAYMASPAWQERVEAYFSTVPKLCMACLSPEAVSLHHVTYERLGAEDDDDLMPLCRTHHLALHDYADLHPELDLATASLSWLRLYRGEPALARQPRNHDRYEAQITVECPRCHALPGQPCVKVERGRTRAILGTHNARKQAAARVSS